MNLQKISGFSRARERFTSNLYAILCFTLAISSVTFVAPGAQAVSIGSGNCASNSSTSNAVVALSGVNCYVAVYATGANTWTPPAGVTTVDFVLIAGGGAGGAGAWGGGGGAGELVHRTSYSVTPGIDLSFSIGGGGTSGTASLTPADNRSNNGGNSWVGSAGGVVANGGGAGASYAYGSGATVATGYDGGSGGGGTEDQSVRDGGTSTSSSSTNRVGYGGNGGKGGPGASTQSGGGGGGAGGVGGNGAAQTGGTGGTGTNAFSVWLSAIRSGMSVVTGWQGATSTGFITAGGGGGTTTTEGSGGAGGGGAGANNTTLNGSNGVANTGSGGGGAAYGGSPRTGGSGGSGLLIIRYVADTTAPTITGPASATGANSTISVAEGATSVHTFTANETVSWSKSGTDNSFFSITSAGGVLTISARDFESAADNGANNTYVVIITATDNASNTTSQTLTVTITNVNEAPTISTATSNPTHTISQAENISSVATYTGSDVDAGNTLTWSITGTDAADFSINSSSGALSFATNPDFEGPVDSDTNNSYIVIVTLSDGALTDTQTVTITITNTNETASVNTPTVSGTIYKGVNTTITVTINVAGKVRFFVGGKRISTCKERTTSGSYPNNSAICTWKPAVTGRQYLTATLTPTDNTFSSSTSARTEVFVLKRTNSR